MTTETRESQTPPAERFSLWFGIRMEPVGKGRPRFTRTGHAYTPAKTRAAERQIAAVARSYMTGRAPFAGPVTVHLSAVYPIPKSWPKKKREAADAGLIAPTVKCDLDNVQKLVLDALNGIVFQDDKQVVSLSALKQYGETPALSVLVEEWRP